MINRIRDVRRDKAMTLADVAAACVPPTTAQTIGRLETGMRTLSLGWMNRIAAALRVEPGLLLAHDEVDRTMIVARITGFGAEPLTKPAEAIPPTAFGGDGKLMALRVEVAVGEYRSGDQIWLREIAPADYAKQLNRDALVPRPGGRFAFGRMVGCTGEQVTLQPPGHGQKPVVVEVPAWLASAEVLVRRL